jgi:glutamine synthetase
VSAVKAAGSKTAEGKKLLAKMVKLTDEFKKRTDKLEATLGHASSSTEKHAKHFRDAVVPAMLALRETSDALESTIPHGMWPLATYREMLFIK